MSTKSSGRFAIVPARAIEDRRLGAAVLRVLCCLGTYGDKDGWCWPSAKTMATRLGIARSTVVEHIQVLDQLGYLEIHQHKRPDGGTASNRYHLIFDRELFVIREEVEGVSDQPTGGVGPPDRACRPRTDTHKNAPKERKKDSGATDEEFETFWRIYPSRAPHSNPKKVARQKFEAAVNRGVLPATIIQGAENYAAYVQQERVAPKYVKQASTWLGQECWAEYQEAPPAVSGDAGRL